jgi:hypothetical protein
MMNAASYHTELVRKFEAAEEASQNARTEAETARDYYDGRQLTPDQIKALNDRKQPIVIENLIQPKVDYLCGLERQTRTDPKAFPRTAMHEDDANAVTDALRYVSDDQDFPIKRSGVFQNMLVEGFGGVEVGHHQTRAGIDPKITHYDWDRLFYDPHSSRPDFSDAMYMGFVTWKDLDEAKAQWPGKEAALEATVGKGTSDVFETYEDKPRWASWVDKGRKRVRICTIYCKKPEGWMRSVFTLSGELEEMAPSPYLDEDGKPENPMILQSAYVDRDNDRFGIVRHYKTLQDEVNKRRSKFLHMANSRPLRISPALGMDANAARKEAARPDAVFIAEQGEVEDITSGQMAAGHFNLLAEAKQAIQAAGPNATMQGKAGDDQSGRAILALQQGGMVEMAPLLDNLRHFNVRVYRAVWNRIRQFWTDERWVRVTDDEKNVRFVGLNTSKAKLAAFKVRDALKSGKIDEQQAMQFGQQIQMDPTMQQSANVLAELNVDIVIDEVPDTVSMQAEEFQQLASMVPAAPPQYIPTMFSMLIEASTLRNKDKLREIGEQMTQQGPDPMQQRAQMIALAGEQAKVEETQSKTVKNMADAQATAANVQISALTAGQQAGMQEAA